jgi:DNA invertase Pin-like site-specific DNA recombinase
MRGFREKAAGGENRERPEFQRMLDQLHQGDAVIVWKLDRRGRSTRDLLEAMETISEADVRFRGQSEHYNSRGQADHDGVRWYRRVRT